MRMPIFLPINPWQIARTPVPQVNPGKASIMAFPCVADATADQTGNVSVPATEPDPPIFGTHSLYSTVEECVKWYWRVKRWNIAVSVTYAEPLPGTGGITTSFDFDVQNYWLNTENNYQERTIIVPSLEPIAGNQLLGNYTYPNEAQNGAGIYEDSRSGFDISCPSPNLSFMDRKTFPNIAVPEEERLIEFNFGGNYGLGEITNSQTKMMPLCYLQLYVQIAYDTGIYTPSEGGGLFSGYIETFPKDLTDTEVIRIYELGNDAHAGAGYITFDGHVIPARFTQDEDSDGRPFTDFSVTITPAEYWQYNGIYHPLTGVQLRNHITGELL